jgi:hypothetical protein
VTPLVGVSVGHLEMELASAAPGRRRRRFGVPAIVMRALTGETEFHLLWQGPRQSEAGTLATRERLTRWHIIGTPGGQRPSGLYLLTC